MTKSTTDAPEFKLLGIRPRNGCSEKYRKVLKENTLYQFYHDYKFEYDDFGEVKYIEAKQTFPKALYNVGSLSVSISAIVGENGSGKSSLIELLYLGIYCLSTHLRSPVKPDDNPQERRYVLDPNYMRLAKERDALRQLLESKETETPTDEYKKLRQRLRDVRRSILPERGEHREIIESLRLSIFFSLNEKCYELQIDREGDIVSQNHAGSRTASIGFALLSENVSRKRLPLAKASNVLSRFFYTISVNYSHYGLNSNFLGSWINTVFHKNDAYLAPLVINPMRNEGNFDINEEQAFALTRLLNNTMLTYYNQQTTYERHRAHRKQHKDKIPVTDRQNVHRIRFKLKPALDKRKLTRSKSGMILGSRRKRNLVNNIIDIFYDSFYDKTTFHDKDIPYKDEVINYIVHKIEKIAETYTIYQGGYSFEKSKDDKGNENYLKKLKKDSSHITFKLRQAINYLLAHTQYNKPSIWKTPTNRENNLDYFDFEPKQLADWMNYDGTDPAKLINYLPPPIFTPDILLTPPNSAKPATNEEAPRFSALSSGEQQLIHSIQSVVYHIINIQSAHGIDDERQTYEAINIIYDEIELYFHPEYQRRFIKDFLNTLKLLNLSSPQGNRTGIRSINILFSTHSPFILSDIPDANVLLLRNEEDDHGPLKTFGNNIHDLLKQSFFMRNGFMGAYATDKINEVIHFFTRKKQAKSVNLNQTQLRHFIHSIGEPLVRDSLLELYNAHFLKTENDIDKEIKQLEQLKRDKHKPNDSH